MDEQRFWELVVEAADAGGEHAEARCVAWKNALEKLTPEEVVAFDGHVSRLMGKACTWDLWAAGFIIHGGCSDDAFSDLRATLISFGKETFEAVVDDPDSLADLEWDDEGDEELFFDGFQSVASEVYEDKVGRRMPGSAPGPEEPTGDPFDEQDDEGLARRCPRLWELVHGEHADEDEDEDEDEDV